MGYRVIQWTTGNVGRRALRSIIASPQYELVGVYAHDDAKVGKDAAELCGHPEPTGVLATNDIDALLALRPDAVSYNPLFPEIGEMCRLLEAGVNIVATSAFITGRAMGEDAQARLRAAAEKGGATIYGTGMNPGFANVIAIVSTQVCERVDQIRVLESVDSTDYDSWETEKDIGFGKLPDDPTLIDGAQRSTAVFGDAVATMADALGVELDEIAFDMDVALASATNELGYATIEKGTISAVDGRWRGRAFGRDVIVLRFQWRKGLNVEETFRIRHGYFIEVDGKPAVRTHVSFLPPADWDEEDFMGLGMIMTAMPAVNAIPAVVAAAPGIALAHDIALFGAGGYVTGA
jgi:hypothetical protein